MDWPFDRGDGARMSREDGSRFKKAKPVRATMLQRAWQTPIHRKCKVWFCENLAVDGGNGFCGTHKGMLKLEDLR
jgi:hypothetical protein